MSTRTTEPLRLARQVVGSLMYDARWGTMGPVHLYLAAWVAGGILLGTSLLLDGRQLPEPRGAESTHPAEGSGGEAGDGSAPSDARPRTEARADNAQARGPRLARLGSFGLIGFGLCGLSARGLGLDMGPWTQLTAVLAGALLTGLGYQLSRSARSAPLK